VTVVLSSFKRWRRRPEPAYSIARWQPADRPLTSVDAEVPRYPQLEHLSPAHTRPRDFGGDLSAYFASLLSRYELLDTFVDGYVETLRQHEGDVGLLCWCPYARPARRQLAEFGTFVCHGEVVREVLESHGLVVTVDADRARMVRM
jgi:hypothetical protein